MTEGKTSRCKCDICGRELEGEDVIEKDGKTFCDNCFIKAHSSTLCCNPLLVPKNINR